MNEVAAKEERAREATNATTGSSYRDGAQIVLGAEEGGWSRALS